jgi:hyperosmotically inducible protein
MDYTTMKRYLEFLMFLLMVTTTSCAAAGVAGGDYAVATDERKTDRLVDDSTITSRVNTEMVKDEMVKAHQVDVDTVEGHVTLTGIVSDRYQKKRAIEIAKATEGTVRVVANLKVK